jgi:PAS domain S-box-containing protein
VNSTLNDNMFFTVFQQANTPLCILRADPPDFTLIAFNQRFEEVTRKDLSGAAGRSIFEVFKPFDQPSGTQFVLLKESLDEVLETRRHADLPLLHFQQLPGVSDGSGQSSWQITVTPVDNSQHVAFLLCTLLNVTENEQMRKAAEAARAEEIRLHEELKQANQRLTESQLRLRKMNEQLEMKVILRTREIRASEQRFKSILNALPEITWTMTRAGKAEFYNKRWYDYTGLSAPETGLFDWQDVVHPDDLQQMLGCLANILDANQPGELETRLRAKDNTYRWFLVRLQPLFSDGNKADIWAVIAAGIDNLKKLQQEKDDFISIASHELKSPLTTLKASLQLIDRIKDSGDLEKFRYFLRQANKSMHKVSTLVDDLLNVRRMNEAQLPLNQKNVNVFQLINGCCNHISITTNHHLVVTGDKDLEVLADEAAIDRVIVNLVNNAVKYAPDSNDIIALIERLERMAKISVIDSGPGIPPEKLQHIFERYYQAEKSPFNNPGLGLGLFISAEIVRRHGGRMGAESKVGKGSTFWFTLPLAGTQNEALAS